ncbi:MAG: flavodoxin family protein [Hormoscilla sp.]
MAKATIVYHSGSGRTKIVAEHVLKGLQSVPDMEAKLMTAEEATNNLELLDQVDAIIFGTPTYMGTVSAPFKAFMDATSKTWFVQGWKDKIAAGFTNSAALNGDKLNTLITLSVFAAQHSMIWVSQGIMPSEDDPESGLTLNRLGSGNGMMSQTDTHAKSPHPGDLKTAELFGQRIGEVTLQWVRGKAA